MVALIIIPNIVFIVVLAILTGYLTFLTTKGGLTDNRHKNYWKRLTKRGKEVFYVLLTMTCVLFFQELNNLSTNKLSESSLKAEQGKRDSLITDGITKGLDSSRNQLYEDISKAFLKQELELDTVKNEIVRIRDSAKTIITNYIYEDVPIIMVDTIGIKLLYQNGKERKYLISFTSADAASTNFNVLCYLVIPIGGEDFDVNIGDIFPSNLQIPKNGKYSTDFTIFKDPNPFEIYICLVGSYSNLDNSKRYSINSIYVFDIEKKSVRTLIGNDRQKVENIIKMKTLNNINPKQL